MGMDIDFIRVHKGAYQDEFHFDERYGAETVEFFVVYKLAEPIYKALKDLAFSKGYVPQFPDYPLSMDYVHITKEEFETHLVPAICEYYDRKGKEWKTSLEVEKERSISNLRRELNKENYLIYAWVSY